MPDTCDNCGAPLSIGQGSAEVEIDSLKETIERLQTTNDLLATGLRGVVGLQEQVKTLQERLDRVEDVIG